MGQMKNIYKTLIGKIERKSPLGRPRYRCEDITMVLRGTVGKVWTGCT
jgi:hypothetical protein